MIFRNSNGDLVEINKYDYPNDQIYYEKVMKLQEEFTKCKRLTEKNYFIIPQIFQLHNKLVEFVILSMSSHFIKI